MSGAKPFVCGLVTCVLSMLCIVCLCTPLLVGWSLLTLMGVAAGVILTMVTVVMELYCAPYINIKPQSVVSIIIFTTCITYVFLWLVL